MRPNLRQRQFDAACGKDWLAKLAKTMPILAERIQRELTPQAQPPCEVCLTREATVTTHDTEGEAVEVCAQCDYEYYKQYVPITKG
jgi:hypothetical protein